MTPAEPSRRYVTRQCRYKTRFVVDKENPSSATRGVSTMTDVLDEIAARASDRTGRGIALAIGSLVGDGRLGPGDQLPTVRALAAHLGVSPNTVADAWRLLQAHGAISTDRRRGTQVRARQVRLDGRYWQVPVAPGTIELDLSTGTPDETLLPPLGPILHRLHADVTFSSYVDPPIVAALEDEIRRRWPCEPGTITIVDGAQDALDRLVTEIVGFGDTVIVEDPTFPPLIDMLEMAGARVVGVALDAEGMDADALADAMASDPVAIWLQPRAHNPTGITMTATRRDQLARVVEGTRTLVVEDDHSGDATGTELHSMGAALPDQVVHIHSFSKSHGPDLRVAAIGGPEAVLDGLVRRRTLGPAWTSRLIQQILLLMLRDPDIEQTVARAAAAYTARRTRFEDALAANGVGVGRGVGLNVWVPVEDEQRAVVALAAHGIGVAPGAPFRVGDAAGHHIRVSVGTLPDHRVDDAAATIAAVATGAHLDRNGP